MRALTTMLAVLIATGCSAPAPIRVVSSSPPARALVSPGPSSQATAAERPSIATEPAPSPPEGLRTRRTVEQDGVRLTLEVDRNPLLARAASWLRVVIENVGKDPISWWTDGCGIPSHPWGRPVGDWTGGETHPGIAGEFKAFALEPTGHAGQAYLLLHYKNEKFVGRDVGCADTAFPHHLDSGATTGVRARWDGTIDGVTPPDGPVVLETSFRFNRGAEVREDRFQTIHVAFDAWIANGRPFPFLTPGHAIDAALADPEFASWLDQKPSTAWGNSIHTLDMPARTWAIGLFRDGPDGVHPWFAMVTMDARTGAVLERRFE